MAWLCGAGVYARDPIGKTSGIELLSFSPECGVLESVLSAEKCSLRIRVEPPRETIAVYVRAYVFVGVRGRRECPCSLARACDEYGEYRVGSHNRRSNRQSR